MKELSKSDPILVAFFSHYDADRQTLRVRGDSFDEVMMPNEVQYHLGAYRPNTKLIYRNLYQKYSDQELRDVMVHEFAHHIWFNFLSPEQRNGWRRHLALNPSPLQTMVRTVYRDPEQFDSEDFSFVIEYPRAIDIQQLAALKIISPEDRDAILKGRKLSTEPVIAAGPATAKPPAAAPPVTGNVPLEEDDGLN